MKIPLAIDGSAYGNAAVAEVARRPWPSGCEVRVIIVDPKVDFNLLSAYEGISETLEADKYRRRLASSRRSVEPRWESPGVSS